MAVVKISNTYLNNINWGNFADCNFNVYNNIDTWRISVSANLTFLPEFLTLMSPDEIERGNRYFQIKDKNRHIVSRGALRIILGKYLNIAPSQITFEVGKNNKPFLKNINDINLQYNLSHSGDWIVISIANAEIGVDVEWVNDEFGYGEIIEHNFSAEEINFIKQSHPIDRFFLLWTRKEALLKATGVGLDDNLNLVSALDGTHPTQNDSISCGKDWAITSFKLSDNYVASICVNPIHGQLGFRDICFDSISF